MAGTVRISPDDLVDVLSKLAKDENLKVSVKQSAKGGVIAGTGATVGGLLGGPIGIAVGATIGTCPCICRFNKRIVTVIVTHLLSEAKRCLFSKLNANLPLSFLQSEQNICLHFEMLCICHLSGLPCS